MTLQFLLILALVVLIHELGHYGMGRAMGCRVTRLQLFFLPVLNYRPRRRRDGKPSWRDTTYSLGIIPLGGLTEFAPQSLRAKLPIARLAISLAGVTLNLVTALIAFAYLIALMRIPLGESVTLLAEVLQMGFDTLLGEALARIGMSSAATASHSPQLTALLAAAQTHNIVFEIGWISFVLMFFNLLPVYPLDGGAAVLEVYELVTGHRPSSGFMRIAGMLGFAFIVIFFWIL